MSHSMLTAITLDTMLTAIAQDPMDSLGWLALADYLEETDNPQRAELVRLTLSNRLDFDGCYDDQTRMQQRMWEGVEPCVPTFTNSVRMAFSLIPAGTYKMGANRYDEDAHADERPQHSVTITNPFWMGLSPVTRSQFIAVTGPGVFTRQFDNLHPDIPVVGVTWRNAMDFCQSLSEHPEEKKAGRTYRLPTEAEWEYACRAGTTTPYYTGFCITRLSQAAWYAVREKQCPQSVCKLLPNAFGLYDMHGNVQEWCYDWYYDYQDGPQKDPAVSRVPSDFHIARVVRGGHYGSHFTSCRSAARGAINPDSGMGTVGFRVVCNHDPRPRSTDPCPLTQAIIALRTNAIKLSPPGWRATKAA